MLDLGAGPPQHSAHDAAKRIGLDRKPRGRGDEREQGVEVFGRGQKHQPLHGGEALAGSRSDVLGEAPQQGEPGQGERAVEADERIGRPALVLRVAVVVGKHLPVVGDRLVGGVRVALDERGESAPALPEHLVLLKRHATQLGQGEVAGTGAQLGQQDGRVPPQGAVGVLGGQQRTQVRYHVRTGPGERCHGPLPVVEAVALIGGPQHVDRRRVDPGQQRGGSVARDRVGGLVRGGGAQRGRPLGARP
ncbi:hypothetical protein [Saccharothrix syringae]|uniref:Uncharacterized protein n=1 Tax=Saccharothrix syringae TaxID=103733 RepID=A0A5Q0H2X2_SACSY|nr:hypothetical protein [Saccharothrix syringae]QFZ20443.1 hypothetical protein EKG83_26195 [Saccharothrix syringae]